MDHDAPSRSTTGTSWSLIVRAGGPRTPDSRLALEELCLAYLPALRALAHRFFRGDPSRAEDLLQDFCVKLLATDMIAEACPSRGRFRTFLRVKFRTHALNSFRTDLRRDLPTGVDFEALGFDGPCAERLYNGKWAWQLIDRALARVGEERPRVGKGKVFEILRQRLYYGDDTTLREWSASLGMSEGTVKIRLYELRKAFHDAVLEAVAETVEDPDEVPAELRELLDALRSCDG